MEPTQVLPVAPSDPTLDAADNGFFEVRSENGVLLALVTDPDSAADLGRFNRELGKLVSGRPRAIILDLSRIQNLALRAVNDFLLFRDQCQEQNINFGLCSLRKSVQKLLDNLGHEVPLQVYPTPEAAIGVLNQGTQSS
jgi:anti-anti-sigma regulatory factor